MQDILGHASPETTKKIYAHYETAHLRDAFDRFSTSVADAAAAPAPAPAGRPGALSGAPAPPGPSTAVPVPLPSPIAPWPHLARACSARAPAPARGALSSVFVQGCTMWYASLWEVAQTPSPAEPAGGGARAAFLM